jgi:hypothetical protein
VRRCRRLECRVARSIGSRSSWGPSGESPTFPNCALLPSSLSSRSSRGTLSRAAPLAGGHGLAVSASCGFPRARRIGALHDWPWLRGRTRACGTRHHRQPHGRARAPIRPRRRLSLHVRGNVSGGRRPVAGGHPRRRNRTPSPGHPVSPSPAGRLRPSAPLPASLPQSSPAPDVASEIEHPGRTREEEPGACGGPRVLGPLRSGIHRTLRRSP